MSNKRGAWISRRGQIDAASAIEQVINRQPQQGEHIQMVADERIADSPYQARRPFDEQSIEDLAQGMREAGFQGVLITRPHSDPGERRRDLLQLVYGHRRRIAWRKVCAERGEPCLLPVVIRDISDERMLMIGAQENLQRQDLDSVEEGQIVAWHEHLFFNKNQAEIGAMLGKSVDWVKARSRVHKLPDALKDRLRARPRAISQMLELGVLYGQQPELALHLAEKVVQEQMTLDALRAAIRNYERPLPTDLDREDRNNQRGAAPIVPNITRQVIDSTEDNREDRNNQRGAAPIVPDITKREGERERDRGSMPQTQVTGRMPTSGPSWLLSLYENLTQTTQILQERRDALAGLDNESASHLQDVVEDLLRELAHVVDVLSRVSEP